MEAIKHVLRKLVGAPLRPLRRSLSRARNADAIAEWRKHTAEFPPATLELLRQGLVRVDMMDAVDGLDHSWRLADKIYPYSCTDEEGLAIAYLVRRNSLRSGFEIATAFGFSSAYIGLALKETRGRLTSVDCYVEEWKESFEYDEAELIAATDHVRAAIAKGDLPSGLKSAQSIASRLEIPDVIDFDVCISPTEIPARMAGRQLDFAFIDGGHFGDQPLRDYLAVAPYLEEKSIVFFHDNNNNKSVARAISVAEEQFNSKSVRLKTRYSLTVVARNIHNDSVDMLRRMIAHRRLGS